MNAADTKRNENKNKKKHLQWRPNGMAFDGIQLKFSQHNMHY